MKKDIPLVSISPYHFRMFQSNEVIEKSGLETVNNQENHKRKDELQRIGSNTELGISDWSMHEKIVTALSSVSSHEGAEEITADTEEKHTKVGYKNGISTLLRTWCLAQLDSVVSNSAESVSTLVMGSKTLLHLKVKIPKLRRHAKVQTCNKPPRNRNQSEELSIDVLYVLSISEESMHDEDINAYELAFDKTEGDRYTSKSLDMLLGKLQVGNIVSSHVSCETSPDDILGATISSLDWMGTAPFDVKHSRYFLT